MTLPECILSEPELKPFIDAANRVHVKSVESEKTLREFLAAILSYMPGWMRFLYRVRAVFVRLLGSRQEDTPQALAIGPEDIDFTKGAAMAFFQVVAGKEGRYLLGQAADKIITGTLGVIAEPLESGAHRFHILTMARYNHWTGRIYFNVINPFHHLVVWSMARHALKS